MEEIRDYKEYEQLFEDDLVVAVRNILLRIENKGSIDLEDSYEHNALVSYFNKFKLHSKISEEYFIASNLPS